jgi:hypothetical protein
MTKIRAAARRLLQHVPARIRSEVVAVVTSFAATFIATARPALPALLGSPHISTLHAVFASTIAGAIAAGFTAAFPMALLYTSEELARAGKHAGVTIHVSTVTGDLEELAKALAPHLKAHLLRDARTSASAVTVSGDATK